MYYSLKVIRILCDYKYDIDIYNYNASPFDECLVFE